MNLAELADGAVQERFEIELRRVLNNILDPNTDWKKKQKLQLTLTFATSESREIASVDIDAKTSLAPARSIPTSIIMDRDDLGNAVGAELKQIKLFDEAAVASESQNNTGKVSYLEQKQSGRV